VCAVVRSDHTGDKEMEEALPLFCFFKEKKFVSSRVMKESWAMGHLVEYCLKFGISGPVAIQRLIEMFLFPLIIFILSMALT
jgi:hypothetical protein